MLPRIVDKILRLGKYETIYLLLDNSNDIRHLKLDVVYEHRSRERVISLEVRLHQRIKYMLLISSMQKCIQLLNIFINTF